MVVYMPGGGEIRRLFFFCGDIPVFTHESFSQIYFYLKSRGFLQTLFIRNIRTLKKNKISTYYIYLSCR